MPCRADLDVAGELVDLRPFLVAEGSVDGLPFVVLVFTHDVEDVCLLDAAAGEG